MNEDTTDRQALEMELLTLGCTIKGKSCTCPVHEDRTASASIISDDATHWRVYCHVCNQRWDVLDLRTMTKGLSVSDQLKKGSQMPFAGDSRQVKSDSPTHVTVDEIGAAFGKRLLDLFPYTNPATGLPDLVIARVAGEGTKKNGKAKKVYYQYRPCKGGYTTGKPEGAQPIFNRLALSLSPVVVVVEGEPCVKALRSIKITATTSPGGAGKASLADWTPLASKKVILWPDNDEAGQTHMREVQRILEGLGCALSWVNPDGMGLIVGGDVADLIETLTKAGQPAQEVIQGIIDDAEPLGGASELRQHYSDIEAGAYVAIPWPGMERLSGLSKACLPGCILTLCADPGAGKSFMMLQLLADWTAAGTKCALFALEDDRKVHLQRIHAQLSAEPGLLDDEWVRENKGLVVELFNQHANEISAFANCITAEGDAQVSLGQIGDWIETRFKSGCRICIVDPVTAAKTEKEPWAADTTFLMRAKKLAREHKGTVILVTHPKGATGKGAQLGGMAGGSAYQRFSHCAMWLEKFNEKDMDLLNGNSVLCNRTIKINKARHGKGGGLTMAINFNPQLRFTEYGIVKPESGSVPDHIAKKPLAVMSRERASRIASTPNESEGVF